MPLSFYALIPPDQSGLSLEHIREAVTPLLSTQSKPSFELEEPAFGGEQNLLVNLPGWWVRFFNESGVDVLSDSAHIAKNTASTPFWIKNSGSRIRVLFGEDPSKTYTNEVLFIAEWLSQVINAAVYVPEEKSFW